MNIQEGGSRYARPPLAVICYLAVLEAIHSYC